MAIGKVGRLAIICLAAFVSVSPAGAQQQTFADSEGSEVLLPQGTLSFADASVSYEMGEPAPITISRDPDSALGPPDWENLDTGDRNLTLGCGGTLVLRFVDNALIDTQGPDLHVFEVGPDVEATELAISKNGNDWIEVGEISGGRAEVDISKFAAPQDSFSFVRLIDDGVDCEGRWPGADIDAVAAIGTAQRFVFDGAVLFETDSAALREAARKDLGMFVEQVANQDIAALRITGHTDSRGAEAYNDDLSARRAESVRGFLSGLDDLTGLQMSIRGAGENEPVATNATERGRQDNRRVEIIAVPGG